MFARSTGFLMASDLTQLQAPRIEPAPSDPCAEMPGGRDVRLRWDASCSCFVRLEYM